MGMAAVPAATTAFGATATASMATAPALLSAAAVSAPIASVGASMMMNPAILSPGGGGLLASFGTAFDVMNKYSGLISTGFSGLQAVGAYNRGQYLEQQYEMQAEQMRADQEINRLNLLRAANDKTRNLLAVNASTLAAGFANGVNGFDGSVKLVTKKNEERYLRDISALEFNSRSSELFQDAQSSLLAAAGDEAVRGSKFDALYHIGNAYKIYNDTRVPT
jgi:hypothetical protein